MKIFLLIMACIAITALSCKSNSGEREKGLLEVKDVELAKTQGLADAPEEDKAAADATSVDTATTANMAPPIVPQSGGPINFDWDKKIIKTAKITLELQDYTLFNTGVHAKLKGYGAYVAQEEQHESDERIQNELTIKVPVDKFEELINTFAGTGIKILEKSISSDDVTGEVVDTKSRLEAKKQVREKYMELLKQAKNMADILKVQKEINDIQEDIESADGRVNYLTHAAAYSTIHLSYYQYLNGITAKDVEPGFLTQTAEAFKAGSAVITNVLLWVISIWPFIIAGLGLLIYYRRIKAKRKTVHSIQG